MNEPFNGKRCAIYCRKSTDDGLEQDYNSLDAQRLSAEHYIASQAINNWVALEKHYDDGGFSGGNVNRPALQELLQDVKAGKIDVVVVYKIDRLSRSLLDFADLLQVFDEHKVTFVSATQQIDTGSSAGRMMLNILMTFAQFEREIISERIRDKMASSRKKGMWVGGAVPFGYQVQDKKLVVHPRDAQTVRFIYSRYMELGSVPHLARELQENLLVGPKGRIVWRHETIYRILSNPTYLGKVAYKGEIYDGQHDALIPEKLWQEVQGALACRTHTRCSNQEMTAMLGGLLHCGHCGCAMYPYYTQKKNGRRYFYYRCGTSATTESHKCPIKSIAANDLDALVVEQIMELVKSLSFREILVQEGFAPAEVKDALDHFPQIWESYGLPEKRKFANLLLEKVTVTQEGVSIKVRTEGLEGFAKEMTNDNDTH